MTTSSSSLRLRILNRKRVSFSPWCHIFKFSVSDIWASLSRIWWLNSWIRGAEGGNCAQSWDTFRRGTRLKFWRNSFIISLSFCSSSWTGNAQAEADSKIIKMWFRSLRPLEQKLLFGCWVWWGRKKQILSTLFHALNHAAIKTSILASGQLEWTWICKAIDWTPYLKVSASDIEAKHVNTQGIEQQLLRLWISKLNG